MSAAGAEHEERGRQDERGDDPAGGGDGAARLIPFGCDPNFEERLPLWPHHRQLSNQT